MKSLSWTLIALACAVATACADDVPDGLDDLAVAIDDGGESLDGDMLAPSGDASSTDGAVADASVSTDTGALDAASADAGPDAAVTGANDAGSTDTLATDAEIVDVGDISPTDATVADAGGEDTGDAAVMDAMVADASTEDGGSLDASAPDSGLHACAPTPGGPLVGYVPIAGEHDVVLRRPDIQVHPPGCDQETIRWNEPSLASFTSLDGVNRMRYSLAGTSGEWTLESPDRTETMLSFFLSGPCAAQSGGTLSGAGRLDIDLVTGQVTVNLQCLDGWVDVCSASSVDHFAYGVGTLACDQEAPDAGVTDAGDYCLYPTMRPPQGGYSVTTMDEVCFTAPFPDCNQGCSSTETLRDALTIDSAHPGGTVTTGFDAWPDWRVDSVSTDGTETRFSVSSPACDSATGFTSYGLLTVDTASGEMEGELTCTQNTPNGCPTNTVTYRASVQGAFIANLDSFGCWQGAVNFCSLGCGELFDCGAPCLQR